MTGRRLDPETGKIYHIKHNAPPKEIEHRLVQRSDDNEDALRARLATHHRNVTDVVSHYADVVSEVTLPDESHSGRHLHMTASATPGAWKTIFCDSCNVNLQHHSAGSGLRHYLIVPYTRSASYTN